MNFNSPNDCYHFLVGAGLVGLCPETQNLVACMDILVRMCACDPDEKKQQRYNQCKQNYIAFAGRAQGFATQMFAKLPNDTRLNFYINNQLLCSITR